MCNRIKTSLFSKFHYKMFVVFISKKMSKQLTCSVYLAYEKN